MTGAKDVTRLVECEKCDGMGDYDTPHPMWGSPSCPEAYVNVKCSECEGSGKVKPEDGDAS
jgi:DnaJ-class molecular chaperone